MHEQLAVRLTVDAVQCIRNCLRLALDVDTPTCELGRQTGILALATNSQGKLVIWHDHHSGTSALRVVVKEHPGYTGRTKRLGDELLLVLHPLDHVNLFLVKFADDILNADTTHPNTRTYRVDTIL